MALSTSSAIRKELESGIEFNGRVHCIACGPEHCCFTSDQYVYVWPVFAEAPLPEVELPFVPATIAIFETRLLCVSAERIAVLRLGDEVVTEEAIVAPRGHAMFPVVSGSCFSECGRLAVAYSAVSSSFLVVSGFDGSIYSGEGDVVSEVVAQVYTMEREVSDSSSFGLGTSSSSCGGAGDDAHFIIEHASFGASHLYLVSSSGQFAAVPLDRFFGASSSAHNTLRISEDEGDVDEYADDEQQLVKASEALFSDYGLGELIGLSAADQGRHITSFCIDRSEQHLFLGLDDGTLVITTGLSSTAAAAPSFSLVSIMDVRTPFLAKRLQLSVDLNVSIDATNVRAPLVEMALMEVSTRATLCITCPLGYAFVDVEGIAAPALSSSPSTTHGGSQPQIVYLELNTAGGDGMAPMSSIGGFGTAIAWHAFSTSVVMRLFVPEAFGDQLAGVGGGAVDQSDHAPVGATVYATPIEQSVARLEQHHLDDDVTAVSEAPSPMPAAVAVADEETLRIVDTILANNDREGDKLGWAGVMRSEPFAIHSMTSSQQTKGTAAANGRIGGGGGTAIHGTIIPPPPVIDYDEPPRPLTAQGFHPQLEEPYYYSGGGDGADAEPTSGAAVIDFMHAKIPLGPKYTTPLELVGAGGPLTAPSNTGKGAPSGAKRIGGAKPTAGGGASPKPLVSATTGRPLQGSVTKPVTFGKPIKGSGYGASANTPWSIQQEQKRKKAAAEAQRAKLRPDVALGQSRPAGMPSPAVIGGVPYTYDCAKSAPPVNPKAKSNEVMAKPGNKVHSGAISCLTYNASATAIISGSSDATLHVLRCPIATHKGEGKGLRGHTAPVLSVDASLALSSHPLVASGARDGCIGVWCPSRREAPFVMENVAGPKDVTAVKFFYQDKLLAAAVGSQLKFFRYALDYGGGDLDRGRNLSRLAVADQYRTDAQSVTAIDCANSFLSTVVVWSGSNRQFGIVDIAAQRTLRQTEDAHTRAIHSVVLVAANTRFASPAVSNNLLHCCATAALDKTVKVWDLRAPAAMQTYSNHMNLSQQVGLCFSPCGNYLVVGSEDRSAFVYDTRYADAFVGRIPMPDVVTACRYHPLEPVLALGTASGDIRLFGV